MLKILQFKLFTIAGTTLTIATALIFAVIIVCTFVFSWLLRNGLERGMRAKGVKNLGTMKVTQRLLHYVVLLVGFGIALQTIGINLSALFAAGAVFAVAIGFAMQTLTQNFVSGIILLLERAIKPDDILRVEGKIVRVLHMGIRATVVRTMDDEELILPNSVLVQSAVTNLTMSSTHVRVRVNVGVSYDADMALVEQLLLEAANEVEARAQEKPPVVLLTDFGASSVDFATFIWVDDPWHFFGVQSELRKAIWWSFKANDVEIPFQQIDIHFDAPAPTMAA